MDLQGGCYCGAVRYQLSADPAFKGQCHCRECQHIAGGFPNAVMGIPEAGFTYTKGAPKEFRRADLENPVTREFCADCGTHLLARSPAVPGLVMLKVGTLDDPSVFGTSQMAIFTAEKQSFHQLPEGVQAFAGAPG